MNALPRDHLGPAGKQVDSTSHFTPLTQQDQKAQRPEEKWPM